jgi:hypothetical protein
VILLLPMTVHSRALVSSRGVVAKRKLAVARFAVANTFEFNPAK